MKTFYFVRHGESEANVGGFHGKPTTPLTAAGDEQAQFIGARCAKLPLQKLIVSTYTRAKQTAERIAEHTGLVPEESDLFTENRYISAYWDKLSSAPESQAALKQIAERWGEPGYHFADEENFDDLKDRADRALTFLAQLPYEHVGVVTHGAFLRNLIGRAIFGEKYTPEISTAFAYYGLHVMRNTALTVLTYDETNLAHPWRLMIYNDHAHLAEA